MKTRICCLVFVLIGFGLLVSGCPAPNTPSSPSSSVPNVTNTPSNTSTPQFSPTSTPTATVSPVPTWTFTSTGTSTATATITATVTVTATFTATATFTPTDTPTVCAGEIFGDTTHASDNSNPYYIYYFFYHASAAVTVTQFSMACLSSLPVTYQFGVYSDDGSRTGPTTLLSETNLDTFPGPAGATTLTGNLTTPVTLTAGDDYWMAMHTNASVFDDGGTGGSFVYDNVSSGMGATFLSPSVPLNQGSAASQPNFAFWSGPCP